MRSRRTRHPQSVSLVQLATVRRTARAPSSRSNPHGVANDEGSLTIQKLSRTRTRRGRPVRKRRMTPLTPSGARPKPGEPGPIRERRHRPGRGLAGGTRPPRADDHQAQARVGVLAAQTRQQLPLQSPLGPRLTGHRLQRRGEQMAAGHREHTPAERRGTEVADTGRQDPAEGQGAETPQRHPIGQAARPRQHPVLSAQGGGRAAGARGPGPREGAAGRPGMCGGGQHGRRRPAWPPVTSASSRRAPWRVTG